MAPPSQTPDTSQLFAQILVELQQGSEPDLDHLCGGDPGVRRGLRAAWLDWRRGVAVLGGRKLSAEADAFLARELDSSVVPPSPSDSAWSDVLEGLAKHAPGPGRYRLRGELARGGMGAILKIWDDDLKRSLAKKVLIAGGHGSQVPDDRSLGRFLEEAQVTAQLEHPGIIPVHDLGVDPESGIYFTMRLVRGHDLRKVFKQVRLEEDGWNQPRALGALLKVCEAMAYAHSRNIVHRDLKPANIMVGRFGEVYVMDWGLARVLTKDGDAYELPTPHAPSDLTEVTTLRSKLGEQAGDAPMFTQDGSVVGTPAFMPPEQGRGELAVVGPRSDVYSVGAILYQLLAGHMPYHDETRALPAAAVLQKLLAGPPKSVHDCAPEAPGELVAICEKAMQRDPALRFADMQEFAEELRAFLENRVVRSYRTGAVPEFVKWVQRNTATAASMAALLIAVIGGVATVAWQQHGFAAQTLRARDFREAPALIAELETLAPLDASRVPDLEHWIASAEDLTGRMPGYQAEFERDLALFDEVPPAPAEELKPGRLAQGHVEAFKRELEIARAGTEQGRPISPQRMASALEILPGVIERGSRQALYLSSLALPRARFSDLQAQHDHDRLRSLVRDLTSLTSPGFGELTLARERLDAARSLALTLEAPEWPEAIASIADSDACPAYVGLELEPQLGLVPLRRDPQSGLWEFLHVLSGTAPAYDADGSARVGPDTGIVLVLLPGGTFLMGAQNSDLDGPNFDPLAKAEELIMAPVTLAPYFLSKYEVTRAQWLRATGHQPSHLPLGARTNNSPRISLSHPVENLSYDESRQVLKRWRLEFPTEAQHEFATRAGTTLPYATSAHYLAVQPTINSRDLVADSPESQVDGYFWTAPVDEFQPNVYGLHNTLGNVREWCLEWYTDDVEDAIFAPGTGELPTTNAVWRLTRGGSFYHDSPEHYCRVSARVGADPRGDADIGIRPARAIDRPSTPAQAAE